MRNWDIRAFHQPDAFKIFTIGNTDYLVTANEGDAKEYDDFVEEKRGYNFEPGECMTLFCASIFFCFIIRAAITIL